MQVKKDGIKTRVFVKLSNMKLTTHTQISHMGTRTGPLDCQRLLYS